MNALPKTTMRHQTQPFPARSAYLTNGRITWMILYGMFINGWALSPEGYAQDRWRCVPDQAIAAFVIQRPGKIADLLAEYLDAAEADPQFVRLLTEGSDPICESDAVSNMFDAVRAWIDLLRGCESICVFVTELDPTYQYCVVIEWATPDVGLELPHPIPLAWLQEAIESGQLAERDEIDDDEHHHLDLSSAGDEGTDPERLARTVVQFLSVMKVTAWRLQGKWLVLGNSSEWVEWAMASCLSEARPQGRRPIVESRRFARARQLSHTLRFDVEGYFSPLQFLPWIDKKYTPEHLETFGFSELVGVWCELSIPASQGTRRERGFALRVAVPYTVPPLGITEIWQCSAPIETAPDIRGLLEKCDLRPNRLVIQNVDRPRQLETFERIYREKNDLEGLESYMSNALRMSGSLELDRRVFSGYTLLIQAATHAPGHLGASMQITSANDPVAAHELIQHLVSIGNENSQFPLKKHSIGDFEGWFLDDPDQRQWAIKHGMDPQLARTSNQLRNSGMVGMNRWIVFADRFIVEGLDGKEPERIDARQVLSEFDPLLVEVLDEVRPWWIEVLFPTFRETIRVSSLRYDYASTFKDPKTARRGASIQLPLPLETRSDRLYAAYEWLFRRTLNQFGPDVQAFASREGYFEWQWRANLIPQD